MSFPLKRVLVVDDHPGTQDAVATHLREAGYSVEVAQSGPEALLQLERSPPFDVVIADIVMPVMSGLQLAQRVRHSRPEVAVVLMTGYASYADAVVNIGAIPLLKPFDSATLARVVEDSLDAAANAP